MFWQRKEVFSLFPALLLASPGLHYCFAQQTSSHGPVATSQESSSTDPDGMVLLPGGVFLMGSPRPGPDDQRPVHRVRLQPYWFDVAHVTNREFGEFAASTNYVSTAEKKGWSLLFDREQGRWLEAAGVCWRHPTGADSSLVAKDAYPVVHVSWFDAVSYAAWSGKRLASEAEYEFASRGGLNDAPFSWGKQLTPGNRLQANYWQGKFPFTNLGQDGFFGVAPCRSFPANPYGLFDMTGNVASWCADWYAADAYASSRAHLGHGPPSGDERVLRGGSWRSTSEKGNGLHVGDREHASPGMTSDFISFRCARDASKFR